MGQRKANRKQRFLSKHLSTRSFCDKSFSPLGKTFPSLSGSEEWAERKSGLNKGKQRAGGASISSPHGQRPGTAGPRGWRPPAHLGLHQLLLDALGGVLTVVQLLQLTLGPLLRLTDVLQQLGGLCASFHSLKGEEAGRGGRVRWPSLDTEKDEDHLLNRKKKNRVTLN